MGKKNKNGNTLYYQQMYAAAFVHPDHKEVVPVFPEMITRKDGAKKNDSERNAAGRFFEEFRREHPHLKVIVVEDGLSSNGPHIRDLKGWVTGCNQITGIPDSGQCPMCKILRTGIKKYADGENFDQAEKGRSGQDNKIDVLVREEICEVRARLPLDLGR